MWEFRASELGDIISDPVNYYKLAVGENVETPAMKNGKEREVLSYSMYDNIAKNKDYKKQLSLEFIAPDFKITGHPDIVDGNMVVDIKNSKRSDEELIKAYWYQLNAYALMCNTKEAWLFVDNNVGQETDMGLTRLIKVPVDSKKFLEDVNNAVKLLNSIHFQVGDVHKGKTTPLSSAIKKLAVNRAKQQALKTEEDALVNEINSLMEDYYAYQVGDYICTKTYRKDTKRKLQMVSETWNGDYKEVISLKEVKK